MKKFTLLVDGQDLDTEVYEYFPYADKKISDFETTFRTMTRLKTGKLTEDSEEVNDYVYAKYCVGKEDTNLKAVEAAYRAFKEFRYFSVAARKKIVHDIHKYLVQYKEELIRLLVIEGHPRKLAEWELLGILNGLKIESLDLFKDELWKEVGRQNNETLYLARKPDGVVCISPPKNASCSNSLIATLVFLGGNTLVVKPPLKMPIATLFAWKEIVNKALKENNVPEGALNLVLGNSKRITEEWLSSPYVNDIIYFGDSETGLDIGKRAFEAGKKPILELSGNDILFVWKDCNLEEALESALDAFLGSTQICMVPKTIVLHEEIYEEFKDKFLQKVSALKVGLPSDSDTCLSPVFMIDVFFEFLNDATEKGAKIFCGGKRIDYKGNGSEKGLYIQPTVVGIEHVDAALNMKCVTKENFFPLIPLIKVTSSQTGELKDRDIFNKMINLSNLNDYGLRASVWVNSYLYIRKFMKYLDNSGLLRINSRHVGFSSYIATHGGTGKSGGPFGEMNYVWQKTTHLQGISLTRKRGTVK
ncbi:MAG: aldehyde dehydrogenase family protein [Candidatus Omnitrophica bacterium]|nr:aldehyde dehydrogenase family protein [Candidatus Omnitrophota bacterium]